MRDLKDLIKTINLHIETNLVLISRLQKLEDLVSLLKPTKYPIQSTSCSLRINPQKQNHKTFLQQLIVLIVRNAMSL